MQGLPGGQVLQHGVPEGGLGGAWTMVSGQEEEEGGREVAGGLGEEEGES